MNGNIANLKKVVKIQHPEIRYLIIHQNHKNVSIPNFLLRPDIKVVQNHTKGLSISRNIGLRNCTTQYALIADDDVEYIEEGICQLLEIIKNDVPDFASFKIKTPDNEPEFKEYPKEKCAFKNKQLQVASIELLVNVEQLKLKNIYFDERFGLGTILRQAEEEILVNDLIKANLEGVYYPIYIVKHPFDSTGTTSVKEIKKYFIKGAVTKRTNGIKNIDKNQNKIRYIKNSLFFYFGNFYITITNIFNNNA